MKIYKKLFAYVQDEKYLGFLAIVFSAISAILTAYGFYLICKFLDNLIINSGLSGIEGIALKSIITLTNGAIFYSISGTCSHILGFRLGISLRRGRVDGLEKTSSRFPDLNSSDQTRGIMDDNVAQTHQVVVHMIPDSFQAIVAPILVLALGFIVNMRIGVTLLALMIIGGLILGVIVGEQKFMQVYQEALSKLSAETVEYVKGMRVIKIFRTNVESFKSFHDAVKDYSKYAYDYSLSCKKPYVLYQWLFFGLIAILIIPIVYFVISLSSAKVILLEFIMVLFLSGVLFVSFMKMIWYSVYISQRSYAVNTLEALYEDIQKNKLDHGDVNNFKNYNMEFEDIDFAYSDKTATENLSFKLEEGKSCALVGSSGPRKSTVVKPMSGFYNVNGGEIKIGGIPISGYSDEALIRAVSFVFQDSKLFRKSICDNIALADKDAAEDDVMGTLKLTGCDLTLDKFPGRESTIISSKGVYLSGGERQGIAIVRTVLKDSEIIIIDEAPASIDPDNEFKLQKAFKNPVKDRTVIMIAHRLSTIKDLDETPVMDSGKIIERGSDKELMPSDTKYKRLQGIFNSVNERGVSSERVL